MRTLRTGFRTGFAIGALVLSMAAGAAPAGQADDWFFVPRAEPRGKWRDAIGELVVRTLGPGSVARDFFSSPDGLIGVVVAQGGRSRVVWTTPALSFLIEGAVINRSGIDMNREAMRALQAGLPGTDTPPRPEPLAAVAPPAGTIPSGPAAEGAALPVLPDPGALATVTVAGPVDAAGDLPALIVFADPRCPHCRTLYRRIEDLSEAFRAAGVRVNWAPVVLLSGASLEPAARILAGGASLLAAIDGGALGEGPAPSVADRRAVIGNTRALLAVGQDRPQVPFLVWRDAKGEAHTHTGAAGEAGLRTIIADIQGPAAYRGTGHDRP